MPASDPKPIGTSLSRIRYLFLVSLLLDSSDIQYTSVSVVVFVQLIGVQLFLSVDITIGLNALGSTVVLKYISDYLVTPSP